MATARYDGAPGTSGGLDLLHGRAYKAQFSSSVALNQLLSTHLVDVDFGERAFTYHVPDGYSALQAH
jgi:hypothetical protein